MRPNHEVELIHVGVRPLPAEPCPCGCVWPAGVCTRAPAWTVRQEDLEGDVTQLSDRIKHAQLARGAALAGQVLDVDGRPVPVDSGRGYRVTDRRRVR